MPPRKTCTYHCRRCGRHFHSLDAFDMHRAFSDPEVEDWNTRVCLDPVADAERLTSASGKVRLRVWGSGVCYRERGEHEPPDEDVDIWQVNEEHDFSWSTGGES